MLMLFVSNIYYGYESLSLVMKCWDCEIRITCFFFKLHKILISPINIYL